MAFVRRVAHPGVGSPLSSRPLSGGVRGRLLGGAAGIALPAASVAFALGVGLPTEASAQSSGFNGTQATTYTLTTGANTANLHLRAQRRHRSDGARNARGHRRYPDQLEHHQ